MQRSDSEEEKASQKKKKSLVRSRSFSDSDGEGLGNSGNRTLSSTALLDPEDDEFPEKNRGGSRSDSDDEFEGNESGIEEELERGGPKKSYRSGDAFYKEKKRDTRKRLMAAQSKNKQLHSGKDMSGPPILLNPDGTEDRPYQGKVRKQPPIDHIEDWVVLAPAVTEVINDEGNLSDAEKAEFRQYAYNHEDNLEILGHSEHKKKKTKRGDTVTEADRKRALALAKKIRTEFKGKDKSFTDEKRAARRKRQKARKEKAEKQKDEN